MQSENIPIKLQFNDDLRRIKVSQNISYGEVIELSKTLFKQVPSENWANVTMKYVDNENETCNVTGELEFREAFHAKQQEVLKLELSFRKGVSPRPTQQPPQPEERRVCWPERFNQHRMKLHTLHQDGIALMDEKKYEEAKLVFQDQLANVRCPWRKSSPLYNIACCESLLGNIDSALAHLAQAIAHGWNDADHMEKDQDFNNIRELEAFKTMLYELRNSAKSHKELRKELRQNNPEWKKEKQQCKERREGPCRRFAALRKQQSEQNATPDVVVPVTFKNFEFVIPDPDPQPVTNNNNNTPIEAVILPVIRPGCLEPIKEVQPEPEQIPEPEPVVPVKSNGVYEAECNALVQMGFVDHKKNMNALMKAKGNLSHAVVILLQ